MLSGSRSFTIVNYGSYGTVPNQVMEHQKKLLVCSHGEKEDFHEVLCRLSSIETLRIEYHLLPETIAMQFIIIFHGKNTVSLCSAVILGNKSLISNFFACRAHYTVKKVLNLYRDT